MLYEIYVLFNENFEERVESHLDNQYSSVCHTFKPFQEDKVSVNGTSRQASYQILFTSTPDEFVCGDVYLSMARCCSRPDLIVCTHETRGWRAQDPPPNIITRNSR